MLDTIFNHRTIRKYKSTPIEDSVLEEILKAGTRASTTGNTQVYSMVVTKEKELKEKLWETQFKQDMVKEAPVVITFCADVNRYTKWCQYRKADPHYHNFLWFFTASIDALLASQNVALAAEANGLGICYMGPTIYLARKIIDVLDLPKGVVPVATLVVGYPDEDPPLTDRLPLEGVVHYETYKDYTKEDIDRIYAEKEAMEETRELLEINQKETLAQIFTDNRYKKDDNLHFSRELLDVLRQQGFMDHEKEEDR